MSPQVFVPHFEGACPQQQADAMDAMLSIAMEGEKNPLPYMEWRELTSLRTALNDFALLAKSFNDGCIRGCSQEEYIFQDTENRLAVGSTLASQLKNDMADTFLSKEVKCHHHMALTLLEKAGLYNENPANILRTISSGLSKITKQETQWLKLLCNWSQWRTETMCGLTCPA